MENKQERKISPGQQQDQQKQNKNFFVKYIKHRKHFFCARKKNQEMWKGDFPTLCLPIKKNHKYKKEIFLSRINGFEEKLQLIFSLGRSTVELMKGRTIQFIESEKEEENV